MPGLSNKKGCMKWNLNLYWQYVWYLFSIISCRLFVCLNRKSMNKLLWLLIFFSWCCLLQFWNLDQKKKDSRNKLNLRLNYWKMRQRSRDGCQIIMLFFRKQEWEVSLVFSSTSHLSSSLYFRFRLDLNSKGILVFFTAFQLKSLKSRMTDWFPYSLINQMIWQVNQVKEDRMEVLLTCITNGFICQLEKHSCLGIHKVCLLSMDSKELGIELGQVLDLSCSRRQSVKTDGPSSLVLSNHVDMVEQVVCQFIHVIRFRESTGDTRDDNVFSHVPVGHGWLVVRGGGCGSRGLWSRSWWHFWSSLGINSSWRLSGSCWSGKLVGQEVERGRRRW